MFPSAVRTNVLVPSKRGLKFRLLFVALREETDLSRESSAWEG